MNAKFSNNWIYEREKPNRDAAERILEKTRRIEKKKIKNGWRWISVLHTTKVLVPCDKKGEPTEQGRRMIEQVRQRLL